MGVCRYIFPVVVVVAALYFGGFLTKEPEPPVMEDGWWGKGQQTPDEGEIKEYDSAEQGSMLTSQPGLVVQMHQEHVQWDHSWLLTHGK